jgi:hypothetical protein
MSTGSGNLTTWFFATSEAWGVVEERARQMMLYRIWVKTSNGGLRTYRICGMAFVTRSCAASAPFRRVPQRVPMAGSTDKIARILLCGKQLVLYHAWEGNGSVARENILAT